MITSFRTSIRGRTIELPWDLELPEDHVVEVTIKTCPEVESNEPPPPWWLSHFEVNPELSRSKLIVKGTRLQAEDMAKLIDEGHGDEELRRLHPELTSKDVAALREYVNLPATMRSLFGAWADEAEELDEFLDEMRRLRKIPSQRIEE